MLSSINSEYLLLHRARFSRQRLGIVFKKNVQVNTFLRGILGRRVISTRRSLANKEGENNYRNTDGLLSLPLSLRALLGCFGLVDADAPFKTV